MQYGIATFFIQEITLQIKCYMEGHEGDFPLVKSLQMGAKRRGNKQENIVPASEFDLADEDYFR